MNTNPFVFKTSFIGDIEIGGGNSSGWLITHDDVFKESFHYGNVVATGSGNIGDLTIKFNASYSNPVYGNSTTVQPPALTMRYIIKY